MKIDITKIEGFAEMSAEEQVKALQNYEVEVPEDRSADIAKLKKMNDEYSSQIAALKKEKQASLSESERLQAEKDEKFAEMQQNYEALLKKSQIDTYFAKFKAQGYDEDLAHDTANAMYDGDADKIFENQNKFLESFKKEILANAMKKTSHPDDKGMGKKAFTKEDLKKMSPQDRYKFSQEHPEEYAALYQ